jgi:hypothetical protein
MALMRCHPPGGKGPVIFGQQRMENGRIFSMYVPDNAPRCREFITEIDQNSDRGQWIHKRSNDPRYCE